MYDRLGLLVTRRWAAVIAVWIGLVAGVSLVAPRWDSVTRDGDFAYLPERMTSVQGERLLESAFPQALSKSQVAIVVARRDAALRGPDFEVAHRLVEHFNRRDGDRGPITAVWSYESQVVGRKLLSQPDEAGQGSLIVLHLDSEFMAVDNMGLVRAIYRTIDVAQLDAALQGTLKAQAENQAERLKALRPNGSPAQTADLERLAAQDAALHDELAQYAAWFRGTANREAEPVEHALDLVAGLLDRVVCPRMARVAEEARAVASAATREDRAAAHQRLAAAQGGAAEALELARRGTTAVLEVMRALSIEGSQPLDVVPEEAQQELAGVAAPIEVLLAEENGAVDVSPVTQASPAAAPGGLEIGVTGSAAVGSDMLFAAAESIRSTELTTIVLVVLILLAVYRAPGLVVVPLVTILASMAVAMGIVALGAQWSDRLGWLDFKVFKTTKIFIVVIVFGAGTDFCLFLIARYKEELQRGLQNGRAGSRALARVGDALVASAMTTILGLATMAFADFGKFRASGPVIAFCLAVTLAACLTLAPALLRGMGRRVFWPGKVGPAPGVRPRVGGLASLVPSPEGESRGPWLWRGIAGQVIARPGLVLTAIVLVLAPLAIRGFSVPVTYDILSELSPDRPSVRGTQLLRQFFLAGATGPVTVLAEAPTPRFESREGAGQIARLTADLYGFEYTDSSGQVAAPFVSVRSLAEPLGGPPGSYNPLSGEGLATMAARRHSKVKPHFLAQSPGYKDRVTRLDLVSRYDPFSRESVRLLDRLEEHLDALTADPQSPWHGVRFHLAGTTAAVRDLAAVTSSDQRRIQQLVVIAVLAVTIVVLRHVVICAYMVLSVLFGYFVTMGATEWFFRVSYGPTFDGLDWKVPVFLFVILVAVGQDYNIYLASRAFEEMRRRGWREGLRAAVIRTGGIITSCGVIMAGTFASMATGSLRAMQELGFALALGVLLDTLVIRTVLLPAFLALWFRATDTRTATIHPAECQSAPPAPHLTSVASGTRETGHRTTA